MVKKNKWYIEINGETDYTFEKNVQDAQVSKLLRNRPVYG